MEFLTIHDLKVVRVPAEIPQQGLDAMLISYQDTSGKAVLLRYGSSLQRHLILCGGDDDDSSRKRTGFSRQIF